MRGERGIKSPFEDCCSIRWDTRGVLLSRQQATQNWHEADPKVHCTDLLDALEMYKDIATEYGLNDTLIQHMRGGSLVTPTRKMVRLIDMTMTSKS